MRIMRSRLALPIEQLTGSGYDARPQTVLQALLRYTPRLLDTAALHAQEFAGSYRGFNVGNASLAVDREGDYYAVPAANYKSSAQSQKVCAERVTVMRAARAGLRILSFHVVGPPQSDNESGNAFPTLHPCGVCRDSGHTFGNRDVVDEQAVVVSRASATHQVFTIPELQLIHAQPAEYADLAAQTIEDPNYSVLRERAPQYGYLLTGTDSARPLPPAMELRLAWRAGV